MHQSKIQKFISIVGPTALFCLVLFIGLKVAHAQSSLGGDWANYLEGELPSFDAPEGASGEDVAASVIRRGIGLVKYIVGGVALLFGIIYAMNFIFARGKEETLSKHKQNFLWLLIGFIILMAADGISQVFNPETASSDALIDFTAGRDQLRIITNYLKWLFGSIIALLMTISGIKMMTASGNEEAIGKEKTHLVWSGIGMLIVLLASNIVNAIYVINEDSQAEAAGASAGITELGGVIRLILVFLGPTAVLFTIYAGFMYMTALDNEDRASKAKTMIVAGVTGIVIIYAAYALVNTFLVADLTPVLPEG
ncbi:hypothetical protein KAR91_75485 [Candidatus Pacearchaeota archaeon]|nr:hypothetical protein [Candidatus Pacearchaeota archaeon]